MAHLVENPLNNLAAYEISSGGLTGNVADPRLILSTALKVTAPGILDRSQSTKRQPEAVVSIQAPYRQDIVSWLVHGN